MNKNTLINNLSKEQILDLADASGRKLGFLLAMSPLQDEIKEGIISILKYATPDQLDALIEMLESGFLQSVNTDMEVFLKKELEIIKKEYDGRSNELDREVVEALEEVGKKLS